MGDDGISIYTYECTKCKNTRPCKLVIPFSVIDTKMCADGASEGDFKLVEQHQNVENAAVDNQVEETTVEKSNNEEVSLPL